MNKQQKEKARKLLQELAEHMLCTGQNAGSVWTSCIPDAEKAVGETLQKLEVILQPALPLRERLVLAVFGILGIVVMLGMAYWSFLHLKNGVALGVPLGGIMAAVGGHLVLNAITVTIGFAGVCYLHAGVRGSWERGK